MFFSNFRCAVARAVRNLYCIMFIVDVFRSRMNGFAVTTPPPPQIPSPPTAL